MTQSIFDQTEYQMMLQQVATGASVLRMKAENCRWLETHGFIDDVLSRIDPHIVMAHGRETLHAQLTEQLQGIARRLDRLAEAVEQNTPADVVAQAQNVFASMTLEIPKEHRARFESGAMTLMEYILLVPQSVVPRLKTPES